MKLPEDYTNYFPSDNLKEGKLTIEPGWFQLWLPSEIEQLNQDYHVEEFAPGFLAFGSSGGGEMLAFDSNNRVVMIPMIGMSANEAKVIANSWNEFVEKIEK